MGESRLFFFDDDVVTCIQLQPSFKKSFKDVTNENGFADFWD